MHCGPKGSPLCIQHCIQLTSLSFQANWPCHSWNMAIKNLTLKIQGQGQGWGQSFKSQLRSTILSDSVEIPTGPPVRGRQLWRRTGNFLLIFLQFNVYDLRFKPWGPTIFWVSNTASYGFIPCMSIHPLIPMIELFRNLTFKIQGQSRSSRSHNRNNILSTHIPLVPCLLALPFLRYSIFKIWTWKSKVKVIAQGHKVGITPFRLISLLFHFDQPCHSWDTAISKFDVENSRSRSWLRTKLKVITWVLHSVDSHPFRSMLIGHPVPELWLFQNLTLKIKGQGHGWGHSSKSQGGSNILSTHIPFVPCQSGIPLLS